MNVTFHALGSFATAAVLSLIPSKTDHRVFSLEKSVGGFFLGILVHGILDFFPHNYPLYSKFDVIFALVLLSSFTVAAQKQHRILILFCFSGAIFPDIVDLSAAIINKHLGIPVPSLSFKVFPWHWKEYSGSIYDGEQNLESNLYHFSLLLICFGIIYFCRKKLFRFPIITK